VSSVYTNGDGGEQSLGYIGDDDSNEEDDGVEPIIAEYESDDEERDAEEHGHARDEVDEVSDLTSYRRLTVTETRRQVSNATHHRTITSIHHQTSTRAYQTHTDTHHTYTAQP